MKAIVYVVHAYRWGDSELHSYHVGAYSKKAAAIKAADEEMEYRGLKYACDVLECEVDSPIRSKCKKIRDADFKQWEKQACAVRALEVKR